MTEQVTRIIQRAQIVRRPLPFEDEFSKNITGWLLWIISDHEAYWIHTKTDKVIASSRNY